MVCYGIDGTFIDDFPVKHVDASWLCSIPRDLEGIQSTWIVTNRNSDINVCETTKQQTYFVTQVH